MCPLCPWAARRVEVSNLKGLRLHLFTAHDGHDIRRWKAGAQYGGDWSELWKLTGYRLRHRHETVYGMDHVTGEPTHQLTRKRERDSRRMAEHRKRLAETAVGSGEAVPVPRGRRSSSGSSRASSSSASGRGRSLSVSSPPSRVPLVPAGHESTFLRDASAPADSAGVRRGFIIPKRPAPRSSSRRAVPSLMSLSVRPTGELGRGHGRPTETFFEPVLQKARAVMVEREDGSCYIPTVTSQSRVSRAEKKTLPRPASLSPLVPARRPLPEVEVRLEQFTPDSTRGRRSVSGGVTAVVAGGSDGGAGSGIHVWLVPSDDSDSESEVTTSSRCRRVVWDSSVDQGRGEGLRQGQYVGQGEEDGQVGGTDGEGVFGGDSGGG